MTTKANSAVGYKAKAKRFRTWVRIPGPPISSYFFPFRQSSVRQGPMTIMHSHHPICQVARWPNLMAIIWRSTIGHSQRATLDPKSQTDLHLLGPSLLFTPLQNCYCRPKILFFTFLYFISLNLLIFILLTNQLFDFIKKP